MTHFLQQCPTSWFLQHSRTTLSAVRHYIYKPSHQPKKGTVFSWVEQYCYWKANCIIVRLSSDEHHWGHSQLTCDSSVCSSTFSPVLSITLGFLSALRSQGWCEEIFPWKHNSANELLLCSGFHCINISTYFNDKNNQMLCLLKGSYWQHLRISLHECS